MTANNRLNRTEQLWSHFKRKASKQPTTQLRNEISLQHQNIVRKIAHEYSSRCRLNYDDLYQIGMIGMLKAVEKFDPTKGVAFSSFATPYVRGEILHHLRDSGSNVKVPRRAREAVSKANKLARQWVIVNGQEPTDQELAELMGVTVAKLQSVREAVAHQHACEFNDDYDEIPAPATHINDLPHQGLEQTWSALRQRVEELHPTERELLDQVFLQNANSKAIESIAKRYNMTPVALKGKLERVLMRIAQ